MSEGKFVYEFEKSEGTNLFIRFQVCEYKGDPRIDIREWGKNGGGVFKPSTKGMSFSTDRLEDLKTGVAKLAAALKSQVSKPKK